MIVLVVIVGFRPLGVIRIFSERVHEQVELIADVQEGPILEGELAEKRFP